MYRFTLDSTNELNGRRLRTIRLVFNGGATEEEEKEAILNLARLAMSDDPKLDAVLIFGFSSDDAEQHKGFDRGRVVLTRDGKGWMGNNRAFPGPNAALDELGMITYHRNYHWIPEQIAR